MSQSMMAIKPLLTEGYDTYNNSLKVDLVSVGYLSPQMSWEHFTRTRFSYGVEIQGHWVNRSTLRDMERSPGKSALNDSVKQDIKWDRRYAGVMICPEGRYYMGNKPNRGFYGGARLDVGVFRESFDIRKQLITTHTYAVDKSGDGKPVYVESSDWELMDNEKGEVDLGVGVGLGIGYQTYFGRNSRWGIDVNCYVKKDWKLGQDTENMWEWFWGPGLPADLDISLTYRF